MASLLGEAVDTNVDCTVVGYSFCNKNDEFKKKKKTVPIQDDTRNAHDQEILEEPKWI